LLPVGLPQPSESLSISGLPLYLTDEQLNAVFSQYGTVDQCKMLDVIPGLPSRGALVTMATVEEAAWLTQNLNNNIPSGLTTPVTVQFLAAPGEVAAPVAPLAAVAPVAAVAPDLGIQLQQLPAVAPGLDLGTLGALGTQAPVLDVNTLAALSALSSAGALAAFAQPAAAAAPVAAAPAQTFQINTQLTGTVKRWDDGKGFGFIVPDGGGPDVFVHIGDLPGGNKLVNGAQVVFEAIADPSKGPGRYRAKTCSGGVPKDLPTEVVSMTDNLFITGLPLDIEEDRAKQIFSQYGAVVSLKKLGNQPGKADAACLVRMGSAEQAEWMVKNVSGNIPTGLTTACSIRYAENKGRGVGRPGPY